MNREDIIQMAREAGFEADMFGFGIWDSAELNRFANLVSAAEREACAKVCEQNEVDGNIAMFGTHYARACGDCAIAIRKRSII